MALKHSEYKERNQQYINEFRNRDDVKELHGGVLYREITKGRGAKPSPRSMVLVNYKGSLINGKIFDSTMQRGRPAEFRLNELILGWRTALAAMSEGAHWEVVIPFNLGYGSRGAGAIKPYSTLVFEIHLLKVRS